MDPTANSLFTTGTSQINTIQAPFIGTPPLCNACIHKCSIQIAQQNGPSVTCWCQTVRCPCPKPRPPRPIPRWRMPALSAAESSPSAARCSSEAARVPSGRCNLGGSARNALPTRTGASSTDLPSRIDGSDTEQAACDGVRHTTERGESFAASRVLVVGSEKHGTSFSGPLAFGE